MLSLRKMRLLRFHLRFKLPEQLMFLGYELWATVAHRVGVLKDILPDMSGKVKQVTNLAKEGAANYFLS
jgi:hypothetical protein